MMFPKRGEPTQRILDIFKPLFAKREPTTRTEHPPLPMNCPKCGKKLGRGKYMHMKHCKG
jgi:hypothetical protein